MADDFSEEFFNGDIEDPDGIGDVIATSQSCINSLNEGQKEEIVKAMFDMPEIKAFYDSICPPE